MSWRTWRRQCRLEEKQRTQEISEITSQAGLGKAECRQKRSTSTTITTRKQLSKRKTSSDSSNNKTSSATSEKLSSEQKFTNGGRVTLEHQILSNNNRMTVQPIGVVRSIYRLCVGTPRQGLLAPHARGRIELSLPDNQSAQDAVIGLEQYSHIWILFLFHLNTLPKNQKVPAKIAPPALGGIKVGVLATRSPHRFNPIGITLAKLDSIEIKSKVKGKNNNGARVVLHISGLDLVDGTPVLDIKPFVPHYDTADPQQQYDNNKQPLDKRVKLPPWVSGGLATRRHVKISEQAKQELQDILSQKSKPLEFYGKQGETPQQTLDNVIECIKEVLSTDVRSSWQTKKARKGKYQAERARRLQNQTSSASSVITTSSAGSSLKNDNNDGGASSEYAAT